VPTQDANLPKPPDPIPEDRRVRRRLRPEERRPEILDAALAVFSDLGFQRATLQDVADRAGVTKGALYHYFASKEQLFIELMRERMLPHVEEDEAMLAVASGSREEILRALMLRLWEHFRQPGQIELTLLAITELPKIPQVGRFFFEEVVLRGRRTMARALARGIERGEIGHCDLDAVAAAIPAMIMGVALGHRVFRDIDSGELSPDRLGKVVTSLLVRGSCGPPRSPTSE
jgi:AcrR family transcriptional regulator